MREMLLYSSRSPKTPLKTMKKRDPMDFSAIIKKARKLPKSKPKPKRLPISKVTRLLWNECKRLIRERDKDCFTCEAKNLQGSNAQCGHFIPSSTCGAYLRFDLRNLALQCMRCNIHGGGQGAIFYENLKRKHGQAFVNQLFADKNKIVNARDHYEQLLELYRTL